MLTPTENVSAAGSATQFDVSDVVKLRQRVSRAATSLKIIGFLSAINYFFIFSSSYLGYVTALLSTMLIPGLANSTAKRLLSGNVRAAAVAAVWCLLWFGFSAFDAFPKSLRNDFDVYSILGLLIFNLPTLFLAWGLIALIRYRPVEATGGDANLLTHPWEDGLGIKVRPRFLNKKSGAAILCLVLSPLPYLWWRAAQFTQDVYFFSDTTEQIGRMLGVWTFAFFIFYWCVRIYRRARREAMLPGSALVKKDVRPIVLYLRSFHDDIGIRMRARATNGRILLETLVSVFFEEVVTDHLWGYGPVLAIGNPQMKDKIAPLGAARDYATDSDWQDQVAELMRQASLIVAIAGQTNGLVWEIDTVVNRGFLSKFVLLLPPVDRQELEARWRFLASNAPSLSLPFDIDLVRARSVIFSKGRVTLICGDERNDWTYEAVLDQAAVAILSTAKSRPVNSQSPVRSAGQFLRKLAPELSIFARSAFVILAIGVLLFVSYGADVLHVESSHPFARSGKERDEFITYLSGHCRKKNARFSEDAVSRFCRCYTNRIADAITIGELQVQFDSKASVIASVSDLKASLNEKGEAARSACLNETLR